MDWLSLIKGCLTEYTCVVSSDLHPVEDTQMLEGLNSSSNAAYVWGTES
jgi:hypothetical protein